MEYTLSLALVDFLPVIFTAIGLYFVYKMTAHLSARHGRLAALGSVLIVAGGFFKAVWKTFMAASGGAIDINWMENGLFVWMAPGYVLLAWGVWQAVRMVRGKKPMGVWAPPLVVSALALGFSYFLASAGSDKWKLVLLIVMVLATVIASILLIVFAFREKMKLAGALFIVNIVCVFILSGMARIPVQTITLQWIEESVNAVSWLCFAVAGKQVFDYARQKFGVQ